MEIRKKQKKNIKENLILLIKKLFCKHSYWYHIRHEEELVFNKFKFKYEKTVFGKYQCSRCKKIKISKKK
jgi:hypothetical protein